MESVAYTLADLVKFTGAKSRRTVQLWAEAGAIRADRETERAGTGTFRRFSRTEAIIACILNAFASSKISIGVLIEMGKATRQILRGNLLHQIERDMAKDVPVYLMFSFSKLTWSTTIFRQQDDPTQAAEMLKRATKHLGELDSKTFIIKLNTYLLNLPA